MGYRAGDRVRIIDASGGGTLGAELAVIECLRGNEDSLLGDYYRLDGEEGLEGLYEARFEIVPTPPAAAKFKVGDRVRVTRDDNMGLYKKGDTFTLIGVTAGWAVFKDIDGDSRFVALEFIEPVPLFAVGDKVRVLEGEGYVGETGEVTRLDGGKYVYTNLSGRIVYFLATCLEHATTDEEAGWPYEFTATVENSTATTGFTIPTDEEALPPKVAADDEWVVTPISNSTFDFVDRHFNGNQPEFVKVSGNYAKVIARYGDQVWVDFGYGTSVKQDFELEAA